MAGIVDTTLFGLIHDYFQVYLSKHRKCSAHTIRAYQKAIEAFLDFVTVKNGISLSAITFEMLDKKALADFLDDLEAQGCSTSTRNHRLTCIRSFFTYAAQVDSTTGIYLANISNVPAKKQEEPDIVKFMNEKALAALLEQPDALARKGLRDRFILLLLYDSAARLQELVDFRLCDIRPGKTPVISIQHGKGGKAREVPLMKQTMEQFQFYKQVFHPGEDDYSDRTVFYSLRFGAKIPLDSSTVRKLVSAYGAAARKTCRDVPEHITPHTVRHTRAMHLYQHGMDLTLLSQWLGHAHLDTTLIYAHADTEQKRKAIELATPKNSPLKRKLNARRYTVQDDETLKRLYGLK